MFASQWTPGRQGGTFVAILGSRAETPSTFAKTKRKESDYGDRICIHTQNQTQT